MIQDFYRPRRPPPGPPHRGTIVLPSSKYGPPPNEPWLILIRLLRYIWKILNY